MGVGRGRELRVRFEGESGMNMGTQDGCAEESWMSKGMWGRGGVGWGGRSRMCRDMGGEG